MWLNCNLKNQISKNIIVWKYKVKKQSVLFTQTSLLHFKSQRQCFVSLKFYKWTACGTELLSCNLVYVLFICYYERGQESKY